MTEKVTPAQRLMNLLLALFHTNSMSREQIRTRVEGYSTAANEATFQRMFERDKELLRSLGVPIITLNPTGHPNDISYRIDRRAYALPPIELTPAELSTLTLAAQVWRKPGGRAPSGPLGADAYSALTKLRAATGAAVSPTAAELPSPVEALAPSAPDAGPNYPVLLRATRDAARVGFEYRSRSASTPRRREVEPWMLGLRGPAWYLLGRDVEAAGTRVFRLSRIVGPVQVSSAPGAFTPPSDVDFDAELMQPTPPSQALVAIRPGRGAALRARGTAVEDGVRGAVVDVDNDASWNFFTVPYENATLFADELASYGSHVVVHEPAELVEAVLARLRAAAQLTARVGGLACVAGAEHA